MDSLEPGSKSLPVQITEDEAAVYDRQIRLWGLEAQQKMRNATILLVRLKGVATEAIKNIVLAGVGRLVIIDGDLVSGEDLGAGFFFRDEDIGKNRAEAAKNRIQALNPLVAIDVITSYDVLDETSIDGTIRDADLVCVTDGSREEVTRINEACRRFQHGRKLFYAGGTYGLVGYIFCDLLKHDYISPGRPAPSSKGSLDELKNVKLTATYPSFQEALQHKWSALSRRQTKEVNPAICFAILALWECQSREVGMSSIDKKLLEETANNLISIADVNKQVLTKIPEDLVDALSTTFAHEFSPVCAVVGGLLAQDALKALAAREPPIANFFTFDGNTGGGTICRMSMQ